jgi:hypothetical protein
VLAIIPLRRIAPGLDDAAADIEDPVMRDAGAGKGEALRPFVLAQRRIGDIGSEQKVVTRNPVVELWIRAPQNGDIRISYCPFVQLKRGFLPDAAFGLFVAKDGVQLNKELPLQRSATSSIFPANSLNAPAAVITPNSLAVNRAGASAWIGCLCTSFIADLLSRNVVRPHRPQPDHVRTARPLITVGDAHPFRCLRPRNPDRAS